MGPTAERRGAVLVVIAAVLLASGVRLAEDPAVAAAARTVRNRPLVHAAALAGWAAQTLLGKSAPDEMARMGCDHEGRRWE
ncbi:MAG TPA: hypothetical protein VMH40_21405 [Myxococcaceae bacterium]|nr:hypothetical protein [Myxococcaceae bacterium]